MTSLRHAGIVVSDLDRSLHFYCDLLGFSVARRMQESGPFVSSILGMEDVEVETVKIAGENGGQIELLAFKHPRPDLAPPPSLTRRGPTHLALTVKNLDTLYETLMRAGAVFTTPPRISVDGGVKVTFCQDPDGIWLELVELLPRQHNLNTEIGFMQGRLSPQVDGKIQAFPWKEWRNEFPAAKKLGIHLMEWTLDHDRLMENPLMTVEGQAEIKALSASHGVRVVSLTGDIFMQMPFWRVAGAEREQRLKEFEAVAQACAQIGIKFIVVPLVDNGAMKTPEEEGAVLTEFSKRAQWLKGRGLAVVFECDYPPRQLAEFIAKFPEGQFGINYDIGNSAALGYDSAEEIAAYFPRILNVHIKDRLLGGTTVPLGTGNARLGATIADLVTRGYRGFYILQTARAADDDHAGMLAKYRDMAKGWIEAA